MVISLRFRCFFPKFYRYPVFRLSFDARPLLQCSPPFFFLFSFMQGEAMAVCKRSCFYECVTVT